jgi:hypothetical protein
VDLAQKLQLREEQRLAVAGAPPAVADALSDRLAWVGHPKAGGLGTDLNRNRVVELLRAKGIQPVRQIAIDETWSALRFRPD